MGNEHSNSSHNSTTSSSISSVTQITESDDTPRISEDISPGIVSNSTIIESTTTKPPTLSKFKNMKINMFLGNRLNNRNNKKHSKTSQSSYGHNKFGGGYDEFFIKLHREQEKNKLDRVDNINIDDLVVSDQRRIVWVSLIGLYSSWRQCPSIILYSSIFILPLKRKWIYSPLKYQQEIDKNIVGHISIFQDEFELETFMELLKWKDSQNLVFWMLDDEYQYDQHNDNNNNYNTEQKTNELIAPFWRHFSSKLTNLYDPVSQKNYNPLKFNEKFWQFSYNKIVESKYGEKAHKILMELYFVTMRYKTMQEIIFQSNKSMNPIISYSDYLIHINSSRPITPSHSSNTSQSHSSITKPVLSPTISNVSFMSYKSTTASCDNYGFYSFENIDDDLKEDDHNKDNVIYNDYTDMDQDNDDDEGDGIWMMVGDYDENDLDENCDLFQYEGDDDDDDIDMRSVDIPSVQIEGVVDIDTLN